MCARTHCSCSASPTPPSATSSSSFWASPASAPRQPWPSSRGTRRTTSIAGIGQKTAERILIDLKDKVAALPAPVASGESAPLDDHTAARDALVGLGMAVAEAEAALRDVDDGLPVGERVRAALAGRAA